MIALFYWNLILRRPKIVIAAFVLIFIFSLLLFTKIRFNFAFEPKDILSKEEYSKLRGEETLNPQETFAIILSRPSGERIPRDILSQLTNDLSGLSDIRYALSDALLPEPGRTDFFRMKGGKDIILMELSKEGYLPIQDSRRIVNEMDNIIASKFKGTDVKYELVGPSPTRVALHDGLKRDTLFVIIPLAIIILLLPYLLYRSWSYVFLPGIAGLVATAFGLSIYGYLGERFTYFSITLAPLLLCVTLMDAMFLVDRFWSKALEIERKKERIKHAVSELAFPCFLTSATTAAGFASLTVISNTPILREYGLFASIGIIFAYVAVFLLIPAILNFWPDPRKSFVDRSQHMGKRIADIALRASANPGKIIFAFSAIFIVAVFFIPRISVEGAFERFFSKTHPAQKGLDELSEHLGSLAPLTLTVYSTGSREMDRFRFAQVYTGLENWLSRQDFIGRTFSPLPFFPKEDLKLEAGETIFDLLKRIKEKMKNIPLADMAGQAGGWITIDDKGELETARLMAWPKKLNFEQFDKMMRYLDNFNRTMMEEFRFKIGGPYLVQRKVEDRFLREMMENLLFSGLLVLLLTLIPLRSFRLSIIFIIVNILPLAAVAGLMGLLKIPFTMALVGLPCILFGLVVDNTIHSLWAYKKTGSIKETFALKGRAMIVTSLLLIVAFGGQFASIYKTNRQFGELAAFGIFIALLADLLLAPALLAIMGSAARRSPPPEP